MAFGYNLHSVLNLGWQTSRQAWRLFAPGQEATFQPELIGSTGRDLDRLAYDLDRLGHAKPARLAYSVAYILNSLAEQTIQFDRELADKSSQIVAILAEMLLELESTSQITASEPVQLVKQIESRWGLVLHTEEQPASGPPRPHFRVPTAEVSSNSVHLRLMSISEELVWASESLLNRVIQEGEFPHTAALGRIHHLGTTLRDRVVALLQQDGIRTVSLADPAAQLQPDIPAASATDPGTDLVSEADAPEESADADWGDSLRTSQENVLRPVLDQPRVLIVESSPFIRMLLTSAIENCGYATHVSTCLSDAKSSSATIAWNLVVCGDSELADRSAVHWLHDCATARDAAVIILSDDVGKQSDLIDGSHLLRRTDLTGLLRLVAEKLGPAPAIRMIA
ncbi:MAG: hypothetical protein JSS49_13095 [Planctomycetes bacterium]|nr:hypothetical protein [Planctomycetota bacterium]